MKRFALLLIFACTFAVAQVAQSNIDNAQLINATVTGTLSTGNAQAEGQGVYLFSGHREDSQCLLILGSNDGITAKPFFPFGSMPGCLYYGSGSDGGVRDPQLFRAPWNNLWYVAYTEVFTGVQSFGLAQSPDLINWTNIGPVLTSGISGSTTANLTWAPNWFMDNSTNCPAQNYTCLHVIVAVAPTGQANKFGYYETHPTNSSLSAWTTPVILGSAPNTVCSYDPAVTAIGSTYYGFFLNASTCSTSSNNYQLWSSSTLTSGWAEVGAITSWTCVANSSGYCEAAGFVQSDTGTYRVYFHDTNTAGLVYFSENTSMSNTGWTQQMPVTGPNQFLINHLMPIRGADLTTLSNVAARSYQQALPLFAPLADAACGDAPLFIGLNGGVFVGNCWGVESVSAAQNVADGYDAFHVVGSSAANSETQHVDIGNWAIGAYPVADSLARAANLGPQWTIFTSSGLTTETGNGGGVYGGTYNNYKGMAFNNLSTYTATQSAQITCLNWTWGPNDECGPAVRVSGSGTTPSGYFGVWNDNGDNTGHWVIGKIVSGGSPTLLVNTGATLAANPGAILLTASGTSSTVLTLYAAGVQVATYTDSSSPLTTGSAGLFSSSGTGDPGGHWYSTGYTSPSMTMSQWTNWVKTSPNRGMAAGGAAATGLVEANGFIDVSAGYLASAMSQQTTATCTNITGMAWPIQANKNYKLACDVPVTFAASATIQFCLAGPGSPVHTTLDDWGPIGASSVYFDGESIGTTSWGGKTTASGAPSATAVVHVTGEIQNGSTSSGTNLTLQTAANGTNGITVLADVSCLLTQVVH